MSFRYQHSAVAPTTDFPMPRTTVIDFETTGLHPTTDDRATEGATVILEGGRRSTGASGQPNWSGWAVLHRSNLRGARAGTHRRTRTDLRAAARGHIR